MGKAARNQSRHDRRHPSSRVTIPVYTREALELVDDAGWLTSDFVDADAWYAGIDNACGAMRAAGVRFRFAPVGVDMLRDWSAEHADDAVEARCSTGEVVEALADLDPDDVYRIAADVARGLGPVTDWDGTAGDFADVFTYLAELHGEERGRAVYDSLVAACLALAASYPAALTLSVNVDVVTNLDENEVFRSHSALAFLCDECSELHCDERFVVAAAAATALELNPGRLTISVYDDGHERIAVRRFEVDGAAVVDAGDYVESDDHDELLAADREISRHR